MSDWHPIETAPDNQDLLIYGGTLRTDTERMSQAMKFNGPTIGWRIEGDDWQGGFLPSGRRLLVHKPTHWMPLPDPPK